MKLAIIGSNGQLGTDLYDVLSTKNNVDGLTHSDIEITDIDNVSKVLSALKPDVVLNTAAYNLVAEAERFPEKAHRINSIGTWNLAKICQHLQIALVHYSTDYVFDGSKRKPYSEDDCPNPLNVYAGTKLSGEYFARNYCDRSYVIRVSGIYGKVPCRGKGGNFITTMIKQADEKKEVKVVDDEILTPTPTYSIATNTAALIESGNFGLYHMTCQGEVSWYQFARVIWETLGLQTPLSPASVKDFPLVVKRPFYSVLENKNLGKLGIDQMPDWKDALVKFLREEFQK
jgi:dTDP-4-dehydrorhamnose reductase